MFNELSENLKKIVLDLETNYQVVKRIPEGILLNKDLYEKSQSQINEIYNEKEQEFIALIFSFNRNFIQYQALINHYRIFYPETKEEKESQKIPSISTPEKEIIKDEKELGFIGLPKPDAIKMGSNGGKVVVSERLVELPYHEVGETLKKRKEDFGIWISQEAIRHFESLRCKFSATDPIFSKIENYFRPVYTSKNWATPIDKEKKGELGICFSVQINRKGHLILHLTGKNKDVEKFTSDFFNVFKQALTDEEIIKLVEMLYLSRSKEKAFKLHDARNIGPKKEVDEKFKGAYLKVNETHWFGQNKYDAYVDYSKAFAPHIEALGPAQQVGNFMKLIDGSPEFIANLTEIRHLSYNNRSVAKETYRGVGALSLLVRNNHQDQISYLSEIEANNDNRSLQNQILLTGISSQEEKNYKLNLETISEIRDYNDFARNSFDKIIKPTNMLARSSRRIAYNMSKLATNLSNLGPIIQNNFDLTSDLINHRSNQTEQLIIDSSREIIDKIDSKIDSLKITIKEIVSTEITTRSEALKLNLELILKKLNDLPGLTTKELIKELQEESKVSSKTIYYD